MRFDVFSIFPEIFTPYLNASILKIARERNLLTVDTHDIRDYTTDKHRMTDDEPYGGGGGMVMKAEPVFNAVESVLGSPPPCPILLMTPQGEPFTQKMAESLYQHGHLEKQAWMSLSSLWVAYWTAMTF